MWTSWGNRVCSTNGFLFFCCYMTMPCRTMTNDCQEVAGYTITDPTPWFSWQQTYIADWSLSEAVVLGCFATIQLNACLSLSVSFNVQPLFLFTSAVCLCLAYVIIFNSVPLATLNIFAALWLMHLQFGHWLFGLFGTPLVSSCCFVNSHSMMLIVRPLL